jgi:hypothetical protein
MNESNEQVEQKEKELSKEIMQFAQDFPLEALALMAGHFVGILEAIITAEGDDPNKEIKIDSGGGRDIVISARKL